VELVPFVERLAYHLELEEPLVTLVVVSFVVLASFLVLVALLAYLLVPYFVVVGISVHRCFGIILFCCFVGFSFHLYCLVVHRFVA